MYKTILITHSRKLSVPCCIRWINAKNKAAPPIFDAFPSVPAGRKRTLGVQIRSKSNGKDKDLTSLLHPADVKRFVNDDVNVGAELTGSLEKAKVLKTISEFFRQPVVKTLALENGLDSRLYQKAYVSFRRFCADTDTLPVDLHIVLSDILQGAGHVDDLFPYFLRHAREIFPHLECIDELKKISDLRLPVNWYPEARSVQRKIIFHAGPTNSGKTYHALESFITAKSGIYCGPLKLLAVEVFNKCNDAGTPCDLVTGEERRYADSEENPSSHVACTVEMTSSHMPYDVAIIDEIQMIKDPQRGWAWTRALLGVCAKEVHLCGEAAAIDMVEELMMDTGDELEVRRYKRLTQLTYLDEAVGNFKNIRPGDCIVCFSKNDIYNISRKLEELGKECAVIYGGLPPGTKLAQSKKFNEAENPCNIMVATDAIGMGLNLCIKRVIFYSLIKPHMNESGEKEMDVIGTSQALQIAGRAGRYGTLYEKGEVTTFKSEDVKLLREIVSKNVELIEKAGLHPTAEQIELFQYHLPNATLSNLIDIFITLCQIDGDKYFICNMDDFKFLADMIEHIPLQLRARYVFCCSPIPVKQPFVCTLFLKFARQFSIGQPLSLDWLYRQIGWPFTTPETITDLVHLEGVFDSLDMYLWLSYRFQDMFPAVEHVRDMQKELDKIIQKGVFNITQLLRTSSKSSVYEDEFELKKRQRKKAREADREDLTENLFSKAISGKSKQSRHSSVPSPKISPPSHTKLNNINLMKGRLTTQLVKQGIITQDILDRLQEEWSKESNPELDEQSDEEIHNNKKG